MYMLVSIQVNHSFALFPSEDSRTGTHFPFPFFFPSVEKVFHKLCSVDNNHSQPSRQLTFNWSCCVTTVHSPPTLQTELSKNICGAQQFKQFKTTSPKQAFVGLSQLSP